MKVELPPALRGSEAEQLAGLYSYIFRLAEYLNTVETGGVAAQSGGMPWRREISESAARTRKYCDAKLTEASAAVSALSEATDEALEEIQGSLSPLCGALSVSGEEVDVDRGLSVAGSLSVDGTEITGAQLAAMIANMQGGS